VGTVVAGTEFEEIRGERAEKTGRSGQCGDEQRKAGTLLLHVIRCLGVFGRNPAMSPFCFGSRAVGLTRPECPRFAF
jgi:hypothetical protein